MCVCVYARTCHRARDTRLTAHCLCVHACVQDPQLVSAAVDAFHVRDVLDERACKRMEVFPPSRSVYCRVPMTRCLYAQLSAQTKFSVPHVFGELPPSKSDRYTPHLLGARLVCIARVPLISRGVHADCWHSNRHVEWRYCALGHVVALRQPQMARYGVAGARVAKCQG